MNNDNVQAVPASTDITPVMASDLQRSRGTDADVGQGWMRHLRAALSSPAPTLKRAFSKKVVPAALIGAAAFGSMPAAAQAGTLAETMTLSSNSFPGGAPVPGGLSGTVPVVEGSSIKLTAPQYLYQPSVPPGDMGTVYEFMFWDVNSTLASTEAATFTAPSSGSPFKATAWYLPVCVVASSCSGVGSPAVTTWAFSLTNDQVLPGTPISSVSPASAWSSPSTSVSTATPVSIAASGFLGPHTKFGGTVFSSWFVFGGGGATVSGLNLAVPAGESPYAIAFYNQYSFHLPPPCIGYPHCI
ncbi:MAG TPA: hypothetical protein VEJ84_06000 [Acidimicrobiales bacterium]|nr:hypothetical protein [Acidimicrobiales bacterium]